jgi:hypothetical protein
MLGDELGKCIRKDDSGRLCSSQLTALYDIDPGASLSIVFEKVDSLHQ